MNDAHRVIGFALGGEAGSRLAEHLDMPTSPDTLLRRVKNAPDEPAPPPRYIGIDDWALRKGQRYGTLVVDLERGRVIDLLPDREATTVENWLREHPGIEVITRDRAAVYAQATSAGAPEVLQVADRWHLLNNLRKALERLLGRMDTAVADALLCVAIAGRSVARTGTQVGVGRRVWTLSRHASTSGSRQVGVTLPSCSGSCKRKAALSDTKRCVGL